MKKKLRDVVDSLDYYELVRMKKDLDDGGHHLRKFISYQIKEREKEHSALCSVCASEIDPASINTFTLMFGSDDFKKKASFCGKDCLGYFISNIDKMKQGKMSKVIL